MSRVGTALPDDPSAQLRAVAERLSTLPDPMPLLEALFAFSFLQSLARSARFERTSQDQSGRKPKAV